MVATVMRGGGDADNEEADRLQLEARLEWYRCSVRISLVTF